MKLQKLGLCLINHLESCYLLKYIDGRDGVKEGANPWAIRHALIYQNVDHINSRSSHLLARLPTAVSRLLGESLRRSGAEQSAFVQDWSHLHTACFSSIRDNLRQFTNYLDQEITDLARIMMNRIYRKSWLMIIF